MPYARRNRKRVVRRKPVQEKRIRKVVKSELKREIEHKWYDRVSTGNADNASLAVANPMTGFVRGTGVNNYIGSSIKVTSLEIRGQLIAADPPGNTMRMIITQDKTTSTTGPTLGTLLNTTLGAPAIIAPFNKDYSDTYTLIKDKVFLLTNDGAGASNFLPRNFRIFISGKKLRQLKFTAGAGNADAGAIWVSFVSDSAVASNPTWSMTFRVNYTDA